MEVFETFAKNFIIGGTLVGICSVVAKYVSITLASLMYSIPFSFIPILLTVEENSQELLFKTTMAIMVTFSFFLASFLSKDKVYIVAFSTTCVSAFYLLIVDKIYHKIKEENMENLIY